MITSILIPLIVLGIVYWLITLLPLPSPLPVVIKVVFIIIIIIFLLKLAGGTYLMF